MPQDNEIDSKIKSVYDVLVAETSPYFIPEFQRNFVWGKKEVEQLLSDMKEDADNYEVETKNLVGYLLGNVVLILDRENNRYIVVDGQQRLTTLTLIARAIEEIIAVKSKEEPDEYSMKPSWASKRTKARKAYCILSDNDDFEAPHIQHDEHLHFGAYYGKLIRGEADDSDIEQEEDNNINEVYNTIQDHLSELDKLQLAHFIEYFFGRVKLIITTAPSEAKAFQLFEILNDRGRSLEPMDLIKNTFLKGLSQSGKEKELNDKWNVLMGNLRISQKKTLSSSTFLKYFLLSDKGTNEKTSELFNHFKLNPMTPDEIMRFVNGMAKASKIYADIETGKFASFSNSDNMGLLFKVLKIRQFHPILMAFYLAGKDKKDTVLDAITRLGAAMLFSYNQTNRIEALVPVLLKEYLEMKKKNSEKAYKKLLENIEKEIEKYSSQVKNMLPGKNHVQANGNVSPKAGYILKFIEVYFNRNKSDVILKSSSQKKASLEHILPQTLDSGTKRITYKELGFESEEERKGYLHRIGNLTLMDLTENISMQNVSFEKKKEYYKESEFIITSTIVKQYKKNVKSGPTAQLADRIRKYEKQYGKASQKYWTKDLIEQRGKDLTGLIYDVLTKKA